MQEAYVALDILTGRVDLFFDSAPAALNYIKSVQRLLPLKKTALRRRTSFSGVFPIKRAGEASGSEQEKLQPACLFPEASGSEGPPLHPFTPWNTRGH